MTPASATAGADADSEQALRREGERIAQLLDDVALLAPAPPPCAPERP